MDKFGNTACLLSLALLPAVAEAHRPYFADGEHVTQESAFWVEEPEVSMVLYGEMTCEKDQLWLSFEGTAGFPLYLQLGVPEVEWLSGYRPSMALLHPELPSVDEELPFEVPEGLGVLIWHSSAQDEASEFYEPYTQTRSWIWQEETVELLGDGRGFVVAWNPEGSTGKLWLAMGTIEDFSGVEWSEFYTWYDQVNEFHETSGPSGEQEFCEPVAMDEGTDSGSVGGCSVVQSPTQRVSGLLGFVLAGLFWGRRRRGRG